jgi:hypothetical protein
VTLPEKIEEVLRLEEQATPGEWESADGTGDGKHRFMYDVVCPTGDGRHRVLLSLNWNFTENLDADRQFIAAARNIIRPLAQAYTAALTALEASDSDRKKLAARVTALEDLVGHCWVHSGYRDCGYDQMDSNMRELYDAVKCLEE